MKRVFKIVKRIETTSLRDALKIEKEAEIVEVFHDPKENAIGSRLTTNNK